MQVQAPHGAWYTQPMQHPHSASAMYPSCGPNFAAPDHQQQPTVGREVEVEVLIPPEDSTQKRGRNKLSNFNPQEDVYLVKAWLEISCDPVTSNSQRQEGFWKRVVERYNFHRGTYLERSLRSLQSRWTNTIKTQVGKFAGYYAEALRQNPSGMSDSDKTSLAAKTFASVEGYGFGFMHCWDIMKDEPKWRDPTPLVAAIDLEGDGLEDGTSLDSNRVNNDADKSTHKRPIGRDKAKAANKKSKSVSADTSSSKYASRLEDLSIQKISIMQEDNARKEERFQQLATIDEKRYQEMQRHNQSVLDLELEKVRIMREKHELAKEKDQQMEDERILAINLDLCPPPLRLYYEQR